MPYTYRTTIKIWHYL